MNWIFLFVPLATFLYLLVDLYAVIESTQAIVRSGSFWILWLLFTLVDGIAFAILSTTGDKMETLNKLHANAAVTGLLTLFFATVGTFAIVQSFSLKFADHKSSGPGTNV